MIVDYFESVMINLVRGGLAERVGHATLGFCTTELYRDGNKFFARYVSTWAREPQQYQALSALEVWNLFAWLQKHGTVEIELEETR